MTDLSNFLSSYFPHLASSNRTENIDRADAGGHKAHVDQATQTRSSENESLTVPLHRIEGYDISHTGGSNAVGSMVVFLDGLPAPAEYRRYYLNDDSSSMGHPDDFESIRETLRRRFRNLPVGSMSNALASSSLPDLLVIDGGKGQLSAAADALEEVGLKDILPVISIAKGEEEIFVHGKSQSINFDNERQTHFMNDGIRLVCRIRDESHRTAVRAHRRRRGKQVLTSGLGSIAGLGAVKRAVLLEHFKGSSEAVAQASEQELKMVTGIGPALAKKIHDQFHSSAKENSQPVVDAPQWGM